MLCVCVCVYIYIYVCVCVCKLYTYIFFSAPGCLSPSSVFIYLYNPVKLFGCSWM